MKKLFSLVMLFCITLISAQEFSMDMVKNMAPRNIGPGGMSGRVTAIDVVNTNPDVMYVGTASGGLWKSNSGGITWEPIFEKELTASIGAVEIQQSNPSVIWVGTGEGNPRNSLNGGFGVYKSLDGGKTWMAMGLEKTRHIHRIIVDPTNPDVVYVGAIGSPWGEHPERGVFKTTDGGKTWAKSLFINNATGIIDVAAAPGNFNVMYAASWERVRKAWNFDGDGSSAAIYKSTDAGSSWTKIADNSGFPTGHGVGRIGLAVFNENTVYALHDSQFRRPKDTVKKPSEDLTKEDFKTMSSSDFLQLTDKKLNAYLKNNGFQEKYRAENVKQMLRVGTVKPIDLASYLEDANSMLFDTQVIGAEIFKSTNGGKSWKKTHENFLDGVYSSYGYYFGEIRVDLQDENGIYVMGVPIIKSKDGGKTFTSISKENVHSDHQALWVNPNKPGHLLNGNDGGLNLSYDDGKNWIKNNSTEVGQFYSINVDYQKPYNVYGGLQDNGVWMGPHNSIESKRWNMTGKYPWKSILGGDGMEVQIDNRNPNIVYTGSQFGFYSRLDLETGKKLIQAMHEPYDSITRWVYDVMPVTPSYDKELTVVMFPFTEKRYKKDGTVEKYRFYERHYIRNGKITGVRKWSQEE